MPPKRSRPPSLSSTRTPNKTFVAPSLAAPDLGEQLADRVGDSSQTNVLGTASGSVSSKAESATEHGELETAHYQGASGTKDLGTVSISSSDDDEGVEGIASAVVPSGVDLPAEVDDSSATATNAVAVEEPLLGLDDALEGQTE